VYYACHGLPYGMEDQTLLINDECSKVLRNPKWNNFFLNHSKDIYYQGTTFNGWTSHLVCGHYRLNCHWPKWFKFIMPIQSNIPIFV
jgi:hypothetical protein